MSDEDSSLSDDEAQVCLDFKNISKTDMGRTSVKYCSTMHLGKGRSAIVYPGYHFGILKPAAVKLIDKEYLRSKKDYKIELEIWSNIDQNINIIGLYDSYKVERGGMFLAMEFAERTFKKQILKCNPQREDIVEWLYQVCSAVECLHEKGVIHRDIKPDNILMVQQDGKKLVAKLADFGVSKMLSNADRSGTFSNANGTVLWMAPEAITNTTGNFKNTRMLDIYALGMVIYFGLSLGGHPFSKSDYDDLSVVLANMTKDTSKPFKLEIHEAAANELIPKMLQRIPEDRPKISQVLSHCLFWNWEKEQLFLIRAAICLSRKNSAIITNISTEIDKNYSTYYKCLNGDQPFNWITIAKKAKNIEIPKLFFDVSERYKTKKTKPVEPKLTEEYGDGTQITKFLKFFRDKYVHYPEMKPEAVINFSDNDGIFCEEKYVKDLISMCPGISAILYCILETYADEPHVKPLSKVYFLCKSKNISVQSTSPKRQEFPLLEDAPKEPNLPANVERLGKSEVYIFRDSQITDNIIRGYFQHPSTTAAIKTRKMSTTALENYSSGRAAWSDIWVVNNSKRSPFLVLVYCLVEQNNALHIAMELGTRSLHLEKTSGAICIPNDAIQATSYLHNISEAVEWLHGKSIPHRNIIPENILIFDTDKNHKIAKLGLSDPCNFKCVSIQETNAFGLDIKALGKVVKFSFFGDEIQNWDLNSNKMYLAKNLVEWTNHDPQDQKLSISQVLVHPLFWNDERSLQFICNLSCVLKKTLLQWDPNIINPKGNAYLYSETSNDSYTWEEKFDPRIIEWLSQNDLKSFPQLLALIEKIAISKGQDMETLVNPSRAAVDDVIKELFYNEEDVFCSKMLFNYIIERIPDMVILCFCVAINYKINTHEELENFLGQPSDKIFDTAPTVIV